MDVLDPATLLESIPDTRQLYTVLGVNECICVTVDDSESE